MASYKKRRRAFEGEEGRAAAISRLKAEANVRSQMPGVVKGPGGAVINDTGPRGRGGSTAPPPKPRMPNPTDQGPRSHHPNPASQVQGAVDRFKQPVSHGSPARQVEAAKGILNKGPNLKRVPETLGQALRDRPRTHQTTRGKRRLSYAEAYGRRTTDTSRARVMELYGRKKPPKNYGSGDRSFQPVKSNGTGGAHYVPGAGSRDGTQGAGLNQVARMRARLQKKRGKGMTLRRPPTFRSPRAGENTRRRLL